MRNLVWTGAVAIIVIASGGGSGPEPQSSGLCWHDHAMAGAGADANCPGPSAVVDRILSFDANGDDRIARDELPERMEGMVSRGDKIRMGFSRPMNSSRWLTRPTARRPPFIVRGPGTIADVIADLKLPPPTHNRALAIVKGPRNVHDPASVDFETEMRELLDDEDYLNFVAALARLRSTPRRHRRDRWRRPQESRIVKVNHSLRELSSRR